MKKKEKEQYIIPENTGEFDLKREQEKVKFCLMRDFVKLRKSKGITQEELSNITGIARPNIARIENGSYNPTIDMCVRLAAGLGMKLEISWTDL